MIKKVMLFVALAIFGFIQIGTAHSMQAPQLSVQDLINQNKLPAIEDGLLNLSQQGLTSLVGLENVPNPEQVLQLSLTENKIAIFPDHVFDKFINLMKLDLSDNPIAQIQTTAFEKLVNLIELDLSNGNLVSLEPATFDTLTKLETLRLAQNKIGIVPDKLIQRLRNLKSLNLQNNKIQKLASDFFSGLEDLKYVSVTGNNLSELPNIFWLKKLKNLYISDNPNLMLSDAQKTFIISQKIFCNAPELVGEFPQFTLGDLMAQLGENWRQELIRRGHLDEDDEDYETLKLDSRGLTSLAGFPIDQMPEVRVISVRNNYLKDVPLEFFWGTQDGHRAPRFPKLYNLTLANNIISELPNLTIESTGSKIGYLDLSSNRIKSIPSSFQNMHTLDTVDLATNHITIIDQNALKSNTLTTLYLETNRLQSLPRDTFKYASALENIYLSQNYLGSKQDYEFPAQAIVHFYPQKLTSLKLLAAKSVAETLGKKNLIEICRTLAKMPQEVQETLLQVAPENAAIKINKAIALREFINQSEHMKLPQLEENLNNLPNDENKAFFELAPQPTIKALMKYSSSKIPAEESVVMKPIAKEPEKKPSKIKNFLGQFIKKN